MITLSQETLRKEENPLWEEVEHKLVDAAHPEKGHLIIYKSNREFDFLSNLSNPDAAEERCARALAQAAAHFPAAEILVSHAKYFQEDPTLIPTQPVKNEGVFARAFLSAQRNTADRDLALSRKLGFLAIQHPEHMELQVPDMQAVLYQWDQLRNEMPNLPTLHILPDNEIADDLAFIKAYLSHDVLYSEAERIHDAFIHLLACTNLIVDSQTPAGAFLYPKERDRVNELIAKKFRIIRWAQKNRKPMAEELLFSLAATVDYISST